MKKERIKILKVEVDKVTSEEALENIRFFLFSDKGHCIVTLNSEMIVRANRDEEFRKIINSADLVVADGMGFLRAASFLKKKSGKFLPDLKNLFLTGLYSFLYPGKIEDVLPEKISGIDLIYEICESDFIKTKKIYLIGAEEGIAEKTKEVLEKKYPQIGIVGAEEGISKESTAEENEKLIERINAKNPDILFVAFGAPKQEKWISENIQKLPSVRVAMGVGGSFDFISGKIPRAPKILRTHGLEWLWRLILQPQRIKRIYNATFKLIWLIFWSKDDMIGE
jgi:N-acetylglucosaminyldiphosphoundecaprenol N-acetyl-beta-D-mannosaminyltransferase